MELIAEEYKQTEVGLIPVDWKFGPLKFLCKSSAFGPRFSGDFYNINGNVGTLRTTDLDLNGSINYSTMPLAQLDETKFREHILLKNDFLLTRSGTCGIAAVFESFEKPVLPGAFLIRFRFKDEVNVHYFKHYINSPLGQSQMEQISLGAVQKNISGTSMLNTSFPFPSIAEQTAIATALSDADALISSLEKLIAKKRNIKQGAMRKLLEPKEGWEVKRLGEIGSFKNGINKGGEDFGFGFPFVNLMDVFGKSKISSTRHLGLINSSVEERKMYDLRKGDVVFIRSSVKPEGVGLTCVIKQNLEETVFSGFIIRFRDNDILSEGFKEYCFQDSDFRNRLMASSSVSANTNINQESLKNLVMTFPKSKKVQNNIANILSDMDAEINALETKLEKYRNVKLGMMQNLLTGKIRLV